MRTVVAITFGVLSTLVAVLPAGAAAAQPGGIHVAGNQLVDAQGQLVRLLGVNHSGAEYDCIRGWGIMEGPTDRTSVRVIRSWYANTVRIGLNEDCWLGINGVSPERGGAKYQQAIVDYVHEVTSAGMYTILDLHWSAPGSVPATSLRQMPDGDHSVDFWRSVATTFANDPNVVFDLFNEPYNVSWECWRDGCSFPGDVDTGPWQIVGMQTLVDAVRASGATQPILVGGLHVSNDLSQWLAYAPADPLGQLVACVHVSLQSLQ